MNMVRSFLGFGCGIVGGPHDSLNAWIKTNGAKSYIQNTDVYLLFFYVDLHLHLNHNYLVIQYLPFISKWIAFNVHEFCIHGSHVTVGWGGKAEAGSRMFRSGFSSDNTRS